MSLKPICNFMHSTRIFVALGLPMLYINTNGLLMRTTSFDQGLCARAL